VYESTANSSARCEFDERDSGARVWVTMKKTVVVMVMVVVTDCRRLSGPPNATQRHKQKS
jgi:hypothetical protein